MSLTVADFHLPVLRGDGRDLSERRAGARGRLGGTAGLAGALTRELFAPTCW